MGGRYPPLLCEFLTIPLDISELFCQFSLFPRHNFSSGHWWNQWLSTKREWKRRKTRHYIWKCLLHTQWQANILFFWGKNEDMREMTPPQHLKYKCSDSQQRHILYFVTWMCCSTRSVNVVAANDPASQKVIW